MRTVDCTACGARFAVPDELFARAVAGRHRRIVCKRCGVRVVIDGTRTTGTEAPWIVAFGEDNDRELTPRQLREAIAMGRIEGSTLVWRDGMDSWVALRTVEEFASAFGPRPAAGAAPVPPAPSDEEAAPDGESPAPADAQSASDPADESSASEPASPEQATREPSAIPAPQIVALPRPRTGLTPPRKPASGGQQKGQPRPSPAAEVGPTPSPAPATGAAPHGHPTAALQGVFAVESMPPVAELSDSEVLSLPPSRPARGPSPPVLIPRAARVPKDANSPPPPAVAASPWGVQPEVALPEGGFDVDVTDEAGPPDAIDVALDERPAVPHPGDGRGTRWRSGWLAVGGAAGVALVASGLLLMSGRGQTPVAETAGDGPRMATTEPTAASSAAEARREPQDAPPTAAPDRGEEDPGARQPDTPPDPAGDRAGFRAPASVRNTPGGATAPAAPPVTSGTAGRDPRGSAPTARGTPTATAAPEPAGAPFDRAAAAAALTAAAASASGCRRGADPSGTAAVTVTFAPSGRVTSVNVSGPPFAGTATGGCIATTLRRATVPPFTGGHVTVSKRIVVQ